MLTPRSGKGNHMGVRDLELALEEIEAKKDVLDVEVTNLLLALIARIMIERLKGHV